MRMSNHRLVFLLNVAHRHLHRWVQARAAKGGVTAVQAGMLFFLSKKDGALMSEAATALHLGASGITGLADRMQKLGLIERKIDTQDMRVWRLWLTDEGKKATELAKKNLINTNEKLTEGFTAEEMDVVARWLKSFQEKFPHPHDDA